MYIYIVSQELDRPLTRLIQFSSTTFKFDGYSGLAWYHTSDLKKLILRYRKQTGIQKRTTDCLLQVFYQGLRICQVQQESSTAIYIFFLLVQLPIIKLKHEKRSTETKGSHIDCFVHITFFLGNILSQLLIPSGKNGHLILEGPRHPKI